MKPFDIFKISALGGLLLIIFSLPMLTATQLVGVLGSHSSHSVLRLSSLSDDSTFTIQSGNSFKVSFDNKSEHRFVSLTNPTTTSVRFLVRVTDPSGLPAGSKLDFGTNPIADLNNTQYNFTAPVVLDPHQTALLAIDTTNAESARGAVTLSIIED